MKIRLIQPAQLNEFGMPIKYRKLFMPSLTLPTVAGLIPEGIDIKITEDYVEDIDYDEDVDLVGITAMSCQSKRAYMIADEFKKRGKRTIMGGIHASICTSEALEHFDSVLVGEAEDILEQIIKDAEINNLQRIYKALHRPDLSRFVLPRYDLLDFKSYVIPPLSNTPQIAIQATRGCPYNCDFCSVHPFLGHQIRKKPIANVIKEIEAINPSLFFFADDNIGADPEYSKQLFKALKPLKKRWAAQMSTTIIQHPELIKLAAEAGCHESFIGVESINENSLKSVNKGFNNINIYKELFTQLKNVGILSQASIVFGFDSDTVDSLTKTIDIVLEWDIKFMYIFILAPLPGTKLYQLIKHENRLLTEDWSLYDAFHPVFKFKGLTKEELIDTLWKTYKRFYSPGEITKRIWRHKKQYMNYFPRDNAFEDIFFGLMMRNSIKNKRHPFSLGLEIDKNKEQK